MTDLNPQQQPDTALQAEINRSGIVNEPNENGATSPNTARAQQPPSIATPDSRPQNNILRTLRTYRGDVEEIMGTQKTSVANIAVAEQKRREKNHEEQVPKKSFLTELKNKSFVTFGIELVLLGLAVVGGVYYLQSISKPAPVIKTTPVSFSHEVTVAVADTQGRGLEATLLDTIRSISEGPNTVTYINTTTDNGEPADVQTIFDRIAKGMPSALNRSLGPVYMIGTYSTGSKNDPFIILTTTDYGTSFAGMLAWEQTMTDDLRVLFDIPGQTASSTYAFTDESIRNKDLRIVQNNGRKTILLYSFLDTHTIIITTNEDTFNSILAKFITSKLVQ